MSALERCEEETQGSANPLVSIAGVLGLLGTLIASAEQDTCATETAVTWTCVSDMRREFYDATFT